MAVSQTLRSLDYSSKPLFEKVNQVNFVKLDARLSSVENATSMIRDELTLLTGVLRKIADSVQTPASGSVQMNETQTLTEAAADYTSAIISGNALPTQFVNPKQLLS